MNDFAVYRDAHSHCCLRVREHDGKVDFIAVVEEGGSMYTDLFTVKEREFYSEYTTHLDTYPVKRAAQHYLNPLTAAITVSPKARKVLESIVHNHKEPIAMSETAVTPATKKKVIVKKTTAPAAETPKAAKTAEPAPKVKEEIGKAERNVAATKQASIKNTGSKPEVAPVVKDTSGGKVKKDKGTWDAKETASEANRAVQDKLVKQHKLAKEKADKKAAAAAKRAAKKSTEATTTNEDTTVSKTTAVKKAPATAKKPAKKAEPAAKKVVKKATAKKAAAPAKKAASKKTAPAAKRGRAGKYTEDQKIVILVKDNPKRAGSGAYDIFELLKKSKTVGDFYAKGGGSHNLRYNEEHEYIQVK